MHSTGGNVDDTFPSNILKHLKSIQNSLLCHLVKFDLSYFCLKNMWLKG